MGKDIVLVAYLINIINESRQNALKKVNEELINMYWKVGEFLNKESEQAFFGDAYIDNIARGIQEAFPGIKGFNRRGLYRMKKFYETSGGVEMGIVTINVPKEVIFSLYDSESKFADYVKITVAKDLYKNRKVLLTYCAQIAEMSEQEFVKCMEEGSLTHIIAL